MRILHIGKYYFPYKGGMESVVRDICEGLAERGNDVHVLCSSESKKSSFGHIKGVKIFRTPRFGVLFSQALNFLMPLFLVRNYKRYDVVHVHCPNPLAELFALFLPKDVRIVCTHHSDVVRQKLLLPFYGPIYKKFLNRCEKIIVPTENHIKYSAFLNEYKEKCCIIPFTTDTKRLDLTPSIQEKAEALKMKYGKFALFVGRHVGYKGLDYLVKSAKQINEKIIIIGTGPLHEDLKMLVKSLNLEEKVIITGRIDDDELFSAYYHASEFLVLPSVSSNENFGVVQLEAMYCSKPVIVTDLKSGVPVVGEKDITSLVIPPRNAIALAGAMNKLFQNDLLVKKMGTAGKKRFHQLYDRSLLVEGHLKAYGYKSHENVIKIAS